MSTHSIYWAAEVRTENDDSARKQGPGHSYATFTRDVLIEFSFMAKETPPIEIDEIYVVALRGHGKDELADGLTRAIIHEAFMNGDAMRDKMLEVIATDGERHAREG